MKYTDLRDFIAALEQRGELVRIQTEVDPVLEMTEIADRTLRRGGPALLFENPKGYNTPVLVNLFGTEHRVALGMGREDISALREIGELLAYLRQPDPPKGMRDAWSKAPVLKQVLNMAPKIVRNPPCQYHAKQGDEVDLYQLPIQTCWPGDAAPLVTWPLVITRGPGKERHNLGIYRMQLLGRNKLIMRWLSHRGGALDFRDWQLQHPGQRYPVAIALGADPATTLAAVTPIPDSISEYAFAGLLRGSKTELAECFTPLCREHGLRYRPLPSTFSRVTSNPARWLMRDPSATTPATTTRWSASRCSPSRRSPTASHRSTTAPIPGGHRMSRRYSGVALNEVFVPMLQKQFPEIVDFYLPPEGCSYRLAVVTMRKEYPGHAKRVMLGVWSFLRQFMYTKFVIVTDEDVNATGLEGRDLGDDHPHGSTGGTACSSRTRPIDYLDFASPVAGLGSKVGFDATNKWPGETQREWGHPIAMDPAVKQRVDELWDELGIKL